jgi:hypothetical protein
VFSLFKLCAKDYIASRWWWLLTLTVVLFYGLIPLRWSGCLAFMINGAFLILGCLAGTLFIEDMFKTEATVASLPLKRSMIVQARTLLAGLLILGGGIIIFGFGHFLTAGFPLRPDGLSPFQPLFTIEGAAGYLFVLSFLIALYLPFYFRSGLFKGSLAYFFTLLPLAIVIAGLDKLRVFARLFGRDLLTDEFLREIGLGIVAIFRRAKTALGPVLFLALLVLAVSAFFFLSIRLSTRFYGRREF